MSRPPPWGNTGERAHWPPEGRRFAIGYHFLATGKGWVTTPWVYGKFGCPRFVAVPVGLSSRYGTV